MNDGANSKIICIQERISLSTWRMPSLAEIPTIDKNIDSDEEDGEYDDDDLDSELLMEDVDEILNQKSDSFDIGKAMVNEYEKSYGEFEDTCLDVAEDIDVSFSSNPLEAMQRVVQLDHSRSHQSRARPGWLASLLIGIVPHCSPPRCFTQTHTKAHTTL